MSAQDVNDDTFDTEVLSSELPVVVDFWAEWCGPCKRLSPNVERVATEMSGKVKLVKLNVDENPVTMTKYACAACRRSSCSKAVKSRRPISAICPRTISKAGSSQRLTDLFATRCAPR